MSQVGYGSSDPTGSPFQLFGTALATGFALVMQAARLVLAAGGTLAAGTVTLPLNPPDGCVAEISSTNIVTSLTISPNTGDTIVNGLLGAVTGLTPVASAGAGGATATLKYAYSLNGDVLKGSGARTWTRIQ